MMPRSRVLLLLAALFLLPRAQVLLAAPAPITDDFTRYTDGSDARPAWDWDSGDWEVRQGVFESDGAGRAFALSQAAPHARRLTVEATVTPRRAAGPDWKVGGLAVLRDEQNYWHLAFVEGPTAQGAPHQVELMEMLDGHWLAAVEGDTALTRTTGTGMAFDWQYNHPYRLRIELKQEGIEGTISELDGTERVHIAYAFDKRAVTSGRPALTTGSLAAGFDDFRATVLESAPAPEKEALPPYPGLGSGMVRGRKTGFFHVEQRDGRWWIIDPQGASFYAVGTDHVNYNVHFCEKLGYAPYHRNVAAKFGSEERWATSATDRLKAWGFNTLGAGCGNAVRYRGLAHTEFLSLGVGFVATSDIAPRTTWTGFPDVFHPRWAGWCERQARKLCAPHRDDPWLLGYFIDNELEWYGKNGSDTGLVDEAFKKPAEHPAKRALIDFLRARHRTIADLNRAWGTKVASYEAMAQSTEPIATTTSSGQKDRADFVRLIAERYFAVTTAAIRKADPNHMVLGCRFAGRAPGVWDIAGKHLDIVTVNYYGQVDLERGISTDMPGMMARFYAEAKRPLMMTEWSFPALDAGLPSQHGAGQRVPTQKEKALCYSIYQKTLFGLPYMVGSDYFMWADEPALGISSTFPEDSNYGLVDVNDNTWPELTQTATRVNALAYALHSGNTAELSGEILDNGAGKMPVLRVRNTGRVAATCPVRIWIQGHGIGMTVSLAAGAAQDLPLLVKGSSLVVAELDPDGAVVEANEANNVVQKVILRDVPRPAVVIANSSAQALRDVPVVVPLGRLGEKWQVLDAQGQPVPAQIDLLPGGPELAARVPEVPARSVVVLRLTRGQTALSQQEATADRALSLKGILRLEHDAGSGQLFDRVMLGDSLLGRYGVLVHQETGQALWVSPDSVERIESFTGPVRTVLLVTAALGAPEKSEAKTAVGPEGVYAQQARRPARYRIAMRLVFYPDQPWFGARFLRLENTDSRPWGCVAYYDYPVSAIAGKAEDDKAAGGGSAPIWTDAAAGLSYGAVVDTARMRTQFWKDTPDGAGEHPDISREINRDLKPGETITATGDDPEVLLFGAKALPGQPGGDSLERIKALKRLEVDLRR